MRCVVRFTSLGCLVRTQGTSITLVNIWDQYPKDNKTTYQASILEGWKEQGVKMFLTLDTYEGVISNLSGPMGLSTVTSDHQYFRRDITQWTRPLIERYLQLDYLDRDAAAMTIDAAAEGSYCEDFYSHVLPCENGDCQLSNDGPENWFHAFVQFFRIVDPRFMT